MAMAAAWRSNSHGFSSLPHSPSISRYLSFPQQPRAHSKHPWRAWQLTTTTMAASPWRDAAALEAAMTTPAKLPLFECYTAATFMAVAMTNGMKLHVMRMAGAQRRRRVVQQQRDEIGGLGLCFGDGCTNSNVRKLQRASSSLFLTRKHGFLLLAWYSYYYFSGFLLLEAFLLLFVGTSIIGAVFLLLLFIRIPGILIISASTVLSVYLPVYHGSSYFYYLHNHHRRCSLYWSSIVINRLYYRLSVLLAFYLYQVGFLLLPRQSISVLLLLSLGSLIIILALCFGYWHSIMVIIENFIIVTAFSVVVRSSEDGRSGKISVACVLRCPGLKPLKLLLLCDLT